MRRTGFPIGLVILAYMVLLPTAAPAQTAEPAEPAATSPSPPYAGAVNADVVNVRSGPGLYYYPLLTVPRGTSVIVEGEKRSWLAIRPPEGVYGLVRKSDLEVSPDGTTATITAPDARVYASSASAKRRWCVMSTLEEGDTVVLVGPAEGEMLRIIPPEGACAYIAGQYVTPTGGAVTPPVTDIEVTPPKPDSLMQDLKESDAALAEETKKPILERDYESVLARYADVAENTEKAFLKNAAGRRMAHVEALIEQREEYRSTVAISARLEERLTEIRAKRAEQTADAERRRAMQRPAFQATGVMDRIRSLEGVDYPIKHKLVDREGRPVVVLKSETYDLDQYVGKAVGVRGTKTYVPEWKMYLVDVDDLELLE
jgi:SH3-like domain-containing protein